MKRVPVRVVKIGGSLLDWPDLPRVLRSWTAAQPAAVHVLVCGGGRFVDAVRQASLIYSLDDEAAHWRAVDCLTVTARLLATICQVEVVRQHGRLLKMLPATDPATLVYDPHEFLTDYEASLPGQKLPHDWTATSDSIAARLAQTITADDLVLLKSTGPPAADIPALVAAGYVDGHFARASEGIAKVRMVNLRSALP